MFKHLLLLQLLLITFTVAAQSGCPDPQATNFDLTATQNDGSCLYPATNYAPVTKTTLPSAVKETSGLVIAGGRLWTHNDSGNDPLLYQIDTLTSAIIQTVTIGGATNVDWEDMTFDGTFFFLGDFGNNANGNRTDLKIYKFPLSAIPAGSAVTVPAGQVEVIEFAYEDQSDFSPQGSNNTRFDCEAMFWSNDSLHLFTKDWIGLETVHYTVPAAAGTYLARKREILPAEGLITGADISVPGVVLLLGYRTDNTTLFLWLLFDHANGLYFNGNKRRIGLGLAPIYGQVEALCFRNAGTGYISNEELTVNIFGAPVTIPARLYSFEIAQWLPAVFLPAREISEHRIQPCGVRPNPVLAGQTAALVTELPAGARIELWETGGKQVWQGKNNPEFLLNTPGFYFLHVWDEQSGLYCTDKLIVR